MFTKTERELAIKYFGLDPDGCDDQMLIDRLDEAVHDAKSEEASDINNSGVAAQLSYLGADNVEV